MRKIVLLIFLLNLIAVKSEAQSSIAVKAFVKDGAVTLRWVPSTKSLFDEACKNGYKVVRYGSAMTNSVILAHDLKPLEIADTAGWGSLMRKDPAAVMAMKNIYRDNSKPASKEREQLLYSMMIFSFDFDAGLAKACGLFLKDTDATGGAYIYKVFLEKPPSGLKYSPGELKVNTEINTMLPSIQSLGASFKNKTVRLKWKAAAYRNDFAAYMVERSEDSINYQRINNAPLIFLRSAYEKQKEFLYYNDTIPTTGKTYFYRIRGLTHFGGLSEPSNVVKGKGSEPLRSQPVIDSIRAEVGTVSIHWRMSDDHENDLPSSYLLMRSKKDKGPYQITFSGKKFSYNDAEPQPSAFYKVGAVAGNDTVFSFSRMLLIADTVPPAPPEGLKAVVDRKGRVTLSWNKNQEADVQGYKIFRANTLSEEFVQINKQFAKEPAFSDQLNLKTLSKTIFYCVAATDRNYNNSVLSKPVEVKRPDTIAPVAPIITSMSISSKGILLHWIRSSSDDVTRSVLYRQQENSKTDVKIREWPPTDTLSSFTDTTVEQGFGYRYKLLVSDEEDNISLSNFPYLFYESGFRKKMSGIRYTVDRTQKLILLSWDNSEKNIENYVIYRSGKDQPLSIIKTLDRSAASFSDKTVNIGNVYEYRIKAVYRNGAESVISDAVLVEY